jgi:hypothetical protein
MYVRFLAGWDQAFAISRQNKAWPKMKLRAVLLSAEERPGQRATSWICDLAIAVDLHDELPRPGSITADEI